MRTFIAIEIPDATKTAMAAVQAQLKRSGVSASWTRPESIHLTLKFLGEVPEESVSAITEALKRSAEGLGRFHLRIAGTGVFPSEKNPRVVWIGVSGELDKLMGIQLRVEEQMVRLGFPQEDRKFTPHLTIGRIKHIPSRASWAHALESVKTVALPGFEAGAISLMKSELKPAGAVYTELGRAELP
jgi:2'-5' RNA ligase